MIDFIDDGYTIHQESNANFVGGILTKDYLLKGEGLMGAGLESISRVDFNNGVDDLETKLDTWHKSDYRDCTQHSGTLDCVSYEGWDHIFSSLVLGTINDSYVVVHQNIHWD